MAAIKSLTYIWQRYFISLHLRAFFFLIFSFMALYILVDYSNQSGSFRFSQIKGQWLDLSSYYLLEMSRRLDVLIPFALLIATIWTVTHLNVQRELIALLCGGISLKRLLTPFLLIGFSFTCLIYINSQTVAPYAEKKLHIFNVKNKSNKKRSYLLNGTQSMPLSDGSILIYHSYDLVKDRFNDVYWIKNIDNIVHMKYLYANNDSPTGFFVDSLKRNDNAELVPTDYHESITFSDLKIAQDTLQESMMTPAMFPLMTLWQKLPKNNSQLSIKEASMLTNFYYRLSIPWLCLLAILAPLPSCVRFSRTTNPFFIYGCSIFSLVAFYLMIDAAVILGSKQVLDPALAIFIPFFTASSLCLIRFKNIST